MSNEPETLQDEQLNPAGPEETEAPEQPEEAEVSEPSEETEASEEPEEAEPAEEAEGSIPDDLLITDYIAQQQAKEDEKSKPHTPEWLRRLGDALLHSRKLHITLLCLLVIAAVVCFFAFGGQTLSDRVVRQVRYAGNSAEFSFDSHSSNDYLSFRRGLAVASVSGLLCLDEDGKEAALVQNRTDPPALLTNDTVALCYGIGGSTLTAAHHRKGTVLDLTIPGTLLDADLSSDSCVCYAGVQSGYKTVLTALDKTGEEIYTWYSSTQFFSQCAISKKARYMAAVALGQNGSSFETTCVLFATDREEPVAEVSLGSDLVYDLRFVSPRRLCAVGESGIHYFDIDGANYANYPYTGGELLFFDTQADNFTAIVRNMNEAGSRFRITTVDDRGEQLAELSLDDEIVDISANGRYLAVLTADSLRVYDRRLRLCLSEDNVGFATRVCMQRDGAVLLIDGASARRVG